ncbi:TcmI family type II polyketide cyclase [Spirillospora sp. CA-294931]|uniref:TcmI family type II polyketide cyclase n=1 Tax=Spirillospora sp. CA-294931 TaxID=3240042 RepID=UPI003D8A3DFE
MSARLTHRALMVRRIDAADRAAVARIFREHDRTPLPGRLGVGRRSLLHYNGLYFHLVEGNRYFQDNLYAAREDPLFREIDQKLAKLLTPFDAERPSMREAQAEEFYSWSDPAPSAAYRVLLEIDVHEGRAEEFERVWEAMAGAAAEDPANLAQSLCRDAAKPDTYHIVSDWDAEESFTRFADSAPHKELADRLRPLGTTVRMTGMHVRKEHTP